VGPFKFSKEILKIIQRVIDAKKACSFQFTKDAQAARKREGTIPREDVGPEIEIQ
jgi:hypothetical protein